MWSPVGKEQTHGHLFAGFSSTPFGVGLIIVACFMVLLPAQWAVPWFRGGVAALLFGGAAAVYGSIRSHYRKSGHALVSRRSGISLRAIALGALVVATGFLGNIVGLPLFELTLGFMLIRFGRRYSFHVAMGVIYVVVAPFVWLRVPTSMIGAASFVMLGLICVIGSLYEHTMILRETEV